MKEKIIGILAVIILCSLGCASFDATPYGYSLGGQTLSPETLTRALSDSRNANATTDAEVYERQAQVAMAAKCYQDYGPICSALGYGIGYGGGVYMPYDFTNLGLMAAGALKDGNNGNDGSNADAADAKKRADRALNEFIELGVELKKEE